MNPVHLLIADDHKIVRDGIRHLLKGQENLTIVGEAENGEEALRKIETEEIDLTIMDINMPVMDGIEATRIIKKEFPAVKVLALTMVDENQYIRKMIEAGASGYVLKSCSKEDLIEAIEKVVRGHHYFSRDVTETILSDMVNPSLDTHTKKNEIQITNREMDVLRLIVNEYTNQEIAEELFVSIRTVDAHRRNLLQKIGAKNTAGLVKYALEKQLF
ncbi:MAG: response regulator transcription factor [Balneolales bacterium]|nr:response regulator transcription factor [Balneolales bacterium]